MSTHKRSPGTELLMVPLCGRNCLGERVPQALNITATYEGRLKCKKMIAFFPHSPIRKLSWKKKKVCSAAISAVTGSDTTLSTFPE